MRDIYNRRNSIQWIQQEDIEYPEKLRPYKGMPKTLYVLGGLPDPSRPSVAVVGARRSTSYGDNIARQFSAELAANGIQIISGLAWGIDTAAHTGALEGGGETYGSVGCGVDVCYPAGNRKLYDWILQEKRGGIISEQEPGASPSGRIFSGKESDHQRPCRSGSGGGSQRKKRIFDYSRPGVGTGKGCLCGSRADHG